MFNKKNRELKEAIKTLEKVKEDLTFTNNHLETQIFAKDELIRQTSEKLYRKDQELSKLKSENKKLKDEAINFYKNEALLNSLKIISSVLKDEEPKNQWAEDQRKAYNRLNALQQGYANPYEQSPLNNLFGIGYYER